VLLEPQTKVLLAATDTMPPIETLLEVEAALALMAAMVNGLVLAQQQMKAGAVTAVMG
jgi:hypothetical protein